MVKTKGLKPRMRIVWKGLTIELKRKKRTYHPGWKEYTWLIEVFINNKKVDEYPNVSKSELIYNSAGINKLFNSVIRNIQTREYIQNKNKSWRVLTSAEMHGEKEIPNYFGGVF